jgi:hypothetical protein
MLLAGIQETGTEHFTHIKHVTITHQRISVISHGRYEVMKLFRSISIFFFVTLLFSFTLLLFLYLFLLSAHIHTCTHKLYLRLNHKINSRLSLHYYQNEKELRDCVEELLKITKFISQSSVSQMNITSIFFFLTFCFFEKLL